MLLNLKHINKWGIMKRELFFGLFESLNRKIYNANTLFLLFVLLIAVSLYGQGSETFTNIGAATNYASRTWSGTNGVNSWSATDAREDQL